MAFLAVVLVAVGCDSKSSSVPTMGAGMAAINDPAGPSNVAGRSSQGNPLPDKAGSASAAGGMATTNAGAGVSAMVSGGMQNTGGTVSMSAGTVETPVAGEPELGGTGGGRPVGGAESGGMPGNLADRYEPDNGPVSDGGRLIPVDDAEQLIEAINNASAGDVITLLKAYRLSRLITLRADAEPMHLSFMHSLWGR